MPACDICSGSQRPFMAYQDGRKRCVHHLLPVTEVMMMRVEMATVVPHEELPAPVPTHA